MLLQQHLDSHAPMNDWIERCFDATDAAAVDLSKTPEAVPEVTRLTSAAVTLSAHL
jgi:hypothetical protein